MRFPQYVYFATLLLSLLCASATGHADDIKVFSVNGVKSVMLKIGPEFEKASGDRVQFTFATIGALQQKLAAGEIPDVLIAISPAVATAEQQGKLMPGSAVEVGRTSIGIAVKEGASGARHFYRAEAPPGRIECQSLVYSDPKSGAASGVAFAQLLEKLGIAGQVKGKTTLITSSVGELIAQGKFELGAQQISELLPVKGIVVRPLPAELQTVTIYRAAILAQSGKQQSAAKFIRFITSPEAVKVFSEAGFGKN